MTDGALILIKTGLSVAMPAEQEVRLMRSAGTPPAIHCSISNQIVMRCGLSLAKCSGVKVLLRLWLSN
jgi:hypothetical protein